ncbi:DDHD domain-containing protein [Melampsora americana]|nr:DDHD domain-containing protein [Melampsora americana]
MTEFNSKPPLITRFLHIGPALSDFNSIVPITTTSNGSNSTTTNSNQTPTATSSKPVPVRIPTVCSAFNSQENKLLDQAWERLSESQKRRARKHYRRSTATTNLSKSGKNYVSTEGPGVEEETSPASTVKSGGDSSTPETSTEEDLLDKLNLILAPSDSQPSDTYPPQDEISVLIAEDTPPIDESEEEEEEDLVLNLALDDEPYIVPVGLDSMFTVDVRHLKLSPAFWHGPSINVFRGEWFYASSSKSKYYPCEPELCEELEEAYDHIRPWDSSYADEIRSALQIGTEAEDKLKFHLPSYNHDVIFQSPSHGRIYSTAVSSQLSKKLLTNFFGSISRQQTQYSGGTVVVRGWNNIRRWNNAASEQRDMAKSEDLPVQNKSASGNNTTADMLEEEGQEDEAMGEVTQLVLVIHGIGQKLAQSYETFDFVHACNQLRLECNKVTQSDPRMPKLLQKRRIQLIPIRWRHSLNFEMEGFDDNDSGTEQSEEEGGSTNKFTMQDIQVKGSINFIREVITGLVLDVPLYMSPKQHRLMTEAVKEQANKVYQLFCRRNSYYTGKKVSIIAHSLGAALTVDILSLQPTEVPRNSSHHHIDRDGDSCMNERDAHQERSEDQWESQKDLQFCFGTETVFLVGSPVSLSACHWMTSNTLQQVAFFFHLHRAQLIARLPPKKAFNPSSEWKRKKRIATDEVGRYGCLAAEKIYNVYISTDPVAYCEFDQKFIFFSTPLEQPLMIMKRYAKQIRPIDVNSMTQKLLTLFESRTTINEKRTIKHMGSLASISSLILKRSSWFRSPNPDPKLDTPATEDPVMDNNGVEEADSVLERQVDRKRTISKTSSNQHRSVSEMVNVKKRRGDVSDAQLRFEALNPTGCVDFVIPSLGMNQYLDMVTAHAAYWSEPRFAKFVLTQLFGDWDLLKKVGDLERGDIE